MKIKKFTREVYKALRNRKKMASITIDAHTKTNIYIELEDGRKYQMIILPTGMDM